MNPWKDPTDDETNKDQVFSDWDDATTAKKNALVNMDIEFLDSEEEKYCGEDDGGEHMKMWI